MAKWRLMLTTLPVVAAVTGVKAVLEYGFELHGVVEFSDVGVVMSAGVFLTGFLLAGTMADYKESEKLPGELACALEALEELLALAASAGQGPGSRRAREEVSRAATALHGWLMRSLPQAQAFAALSQLTAFVEQVEHTGGGAWAARAVAEVHALRRAVTRIGVISRTGFLPPAYAILETLTVMIVSLLLASRFKSALAEFILVPFATLLSVYMLRLIRDIDDPFEYAADGRKVGGAEVDLFPLTEYRARLAQRLQA